MLESSGTARQSGCPWPRVLGGDELCSVRGAAVPRSPPAAAREVRGATRPHALQKQPQSWVAGAWPFPGVSLGPRAMPILSGSLEAEQRGLPRVMARACRTPTCARFAPSIPPAMALLLRTLGVCPPHTLAWASQRPETLFVLSPQCRSAVPVALGHAVNRGSLHVIPQGRVEPSLARTAHAGARPGPGQDSGSMLGWELHPCFP